ncbi:unnamed protein product [Ranitomeya imitator]|uniref:H15 domain-containing protein n=1 Tax=Ranitomeya imitator TaxID=111125 RepID=A0ABN9M5V9_9NEOB|nr:unnamed protein product [Ranitomeya imitator]
MIGLGETKTSKHRGDTITVFLNAVIPETLPPSLMGNMQMQVLSAGGYDVEKNNSRLKLAVRSLVTKGALLQVKGSGASGSFKAEQEAGDEGQSGQEEASSCGQTQETRCCQESRQISEEAKKAPTAAKKSPKKAKKPAAAKKAAKSPKKPKAAPKPKKGTKSPAKKAAKPSKSPAKKAAKAKKPAAKK